MLILDTLLLAPFRGVALIVDQVRKAAEQELEGEHDAVRDNLRELYMRWETGQVSEEEFDAREKTLLDRLDALTADAPETTDESPDDNADGNEPEPSSRREACVSSAGDV
ncbi:MAG: gas vesicle protein GvpG [Phycisphaerae bacterium]